MRRQAHHARSHGLSFFASGIVLGLGLFVAGGPTSSTASEGVDPAPAPVVADVADGLADPVALGLEIYGRCRACHAIETDRVGPRHCGLFGRRAGSVEDFAYSEAMRTSGIVWGRASLDRFLENPMGVVPGTLMTYAGVSDARDRALLIAWLEISTVSELCRSSKGRPADS